MSRKNFILFYAGIFLFIFFAKMSISVAPAIFNLDKKTVNAVILQLELENNSKDSSESLKDLNNFIKKGTEFHTIFEFKLENILLIEKKIVVNKHKFYLKKFFPSVPTPPPNYC